MELESDITATEQQQQLVKTELSCNLACNKQLCDLYTYLLGPPEI